MIRITRHFFDQRKPIGCVCHGVEIPARADRVRGRRMATVAKCRFDLEICGGIYVDAPCVVDENLVSGRTFHDHGAFVGPWVRLLVEARKRLDPRVARRRHRESKPSRRRFASLTPFAFRRNVRIPIDVLPDTTFVLRTAVRRSLLRGSGCRKCSRFAAGDARE